MSIQTKSHEYTVFTLYPPVCLFDNAARYRKSSCTDEICAIESNVDIPASPKGERFSVVCPIVRSLAEPIRQAPRLNTLCGKSIAIVGGSFMASVTHPELKRIILAEYPDAKVYILNEIGSAGVFPGPGITRRSVEDFKSRLKELDIDAVISGNGGCGLCTPKETGSSIAAEAIGIPAVTIAAPGFSEQVKTTAANSGLQVARVAVYPGSFTAHSEHELIANTRTILWPQILDALTRPHLRTGKSSIRHTN